MGFSVKQNVFYHRYWIGEHLARQQGGVHILAFTMLFPGVFNESGDHWGQECNEEIKDHRAEPSKVSVHVEIKPKREVDDGWTWNNSVH